MGPLRGSKKRKKIHKTIVKSEEGSEDWWDEFSKRMNGVLSPSMKDLDKFKSTFAVSRKTFDYICSLIQNMPGNFNFMNGDPLCLNDQVAIALRRLCSGESLMVIAEKFGLNHSAVSQVTWNFVEVMERRALHHLQWPSPSETTRIKSQFQKISGLPNCCGAIDTTHIIITIPSGDSTSKTWLDREHNHSMVLQAIVDPDLRFRDIVTGWPGQLDHEKILRSSNFFRLCEEGKRLAGEDTENKGSICREYIVGDLGFPLLPWLVTPFQDGDNRVRVRDGDVSMEFNRRHLRARKVAEKALGRLKEKWRIIEGVMWRPDKHRLPRIILVCCLLHNIVIDLEKEKEEEEEDEVLRRRRRRHDPGYRKQVCEFVDMDALVQREKLALFLKSL